jgi:regulator of protease activity HflC (stomatin/prohibitin superfamily)
MIVVDLVLGGSAIYLHASGLNGQAIGLAIPFSLISVWVGCGFFKVSQQTEVLIETFGRYTRTASPGLNWILLGVQRKAATMDLREAKIDLPPLEVASRDVYVTLLFKIVLRVVDPYRAHYVAKDPVSIILAKIEEITRSLVPHLGFKALNANKSFLAKIALNGTPSGTQDIHWQERNPLKPVGEDIEDRDDKIKMEDEIKGIADLATSLGYKVGELMLIDVDPKEEVKKAMDAQETQRLDRLAATDYANAEKIKTVTAAEAKKASDVLEGEAQKKIRILQAEAERIESERRGQGLAAEQIAFMDGFLEAFKKFQEANPGVDQEVLVRLFIDLHLTSKSQETLERVSATSGANLFLTTTTGQGQGTVRDQMIQGIRAAGASQKPAESPKTTKQEKNAKPAATEEPADKK